MFVFFSKPILSKTRSVFMATMIFTPCFVKAIPVEKAQMPSELMDSCDMLWVGAEKETVQLVPADFLVVPVNVDLVSEGFSELSSFLDHNSAPIAPYLEPVIGDNPKKNPRNPDKGDDYSGFYAWLLMSPIFFWLLFPLHDNESRKSNDKPKPPER
jgi:hypothetical protein